MLVVASVAGAEFSAAIAIADGIEPPEGDRRCEALARRGQFLRATGVAEWPDGTVAGRYAFIHALYQSVLYARISSGRRASLHLQIGERLERGYGRRAGEIVGELAMHFEQGRDFERAVRYRRQAAENALRQHGYREAIDHAHRALEVLKALPAAPERIEQELTLQCLLGAALTVTLGFAAPEVARVYARARDLCERAENTAPLFPALLAVGRFHHIRGEVDIALAQGARLLTLAEATGDATVRLAAHNALGIMSFYAGDFDTALAHLERGIEFYAPEEHSPTRSTAFRTGQDLGISCAVYAAWTLQLLGYPARAAARMREALRSARALEHPFSAAYACHFAAAFYQCRREPDTVRELEDEALAYSTEHGFRIYPMLAAIHRGWCLSLQSRGEEGLRLIQEGLAALTAFGTDHRRPAFLSLLAELYGNMERPEDGLAVVADAVAAGQHTGQRFWDAELYRLKGALVLQSAARGRDAEREPSDARSAAPGIDAAADAELCFLEALAIARRQGARMFELRAATSLGRLWAGQGRTHEARAMLSEVYHSFSEGHDTADLSEANALLERLESGSEPTETPVPAA
jgi:predicted ATPase